MKVKLSVYVVILLVWILTFSTKIFALTPGTTFSFYDTMSGSLSNPWTHVLDNTDFSPMLSGFEILDITSASLTIDFTFTPAEVSYGNHEFYLALEIPRLDGYFTGEHFRYRGLDSGPITVEWTADITKLPALNAIEDRIAEIRLVPIIGSINSINASTLSGAGVVAPEPLSMVLVGIGFAGLPLAVRLRKSLRG